MTNKVLVLLAVLVPVLGSFLLAPVGRKSVKACGWLALSLVCVSMACAVALMPAVLTGEPIVIEQGFLLQFSFTLRADALAVFMAFVSSFISAIIVLYSTDYISHYEHQVEYYVMVVLFLGAMMGLVFSANLILLYVFWEITALSSWRLIGFFREKQQVLRADKAFLVTVFGALAMLLGFIMVYADVGTFDMMEIKDRMASSTLPGIVVLLIMLGILSKSATLPFHTWLPDAGVAPSPVTALLHAAVLVKIGVYVYARLFVVTFDISPTAHTVILVVAALSALVSAGAALLDTDMKRIIAFSTVSQIAFIFLGFAAGGDMGVAGALLYILMHGLAKGGLFLCAGIVEQNTHTKDITKMGGLIRTMPVTAVAFLFCAFSVMGIPPFGGFFCKYLVIAAASGPHPWIAVTFVAGAVMTILYLFRLFNCIFMGEQRLPQAQEKSPLMVTCVAALAVLSLAGGLLICFPADFVRIAALQMLGN